MYISEAEAVAKLCVRSSMVPHCRRGTATNQVLHHVPVQMDLLVHRPWKSRFNRNTAAISLSAPHSLHQGFSERTVSPCMNECGSC